MPDELTQEEKDRIDNGWERVAVLVESGREIVKKTPKYAYFATQLAEKFTPEELSYWTVASIEGTIQLAELASRSVEAAKAGVGARLDEVRYEAYRQGCIDAAARIGSQLGDLGLRSEGASNATDLYAPGDELAALVAENLGGPVALTVFDARYATEGTDIDDAILNADLVIGLDGKVIKFRYGDLEEGQALIDQASDPLGCGEPECACATVLAPDEPAEGDLGGAEKQPVEE